MRRPLLLIACLAASLAALAPAGSHALSLKKYTSTACPYSIKYPSDWAFSPGAKQDAFYFQASAEVFVQVGVSCGYGTYHNSIRRLTQAVAVNYARQGYTVGGAQYHKNQLGLFFGQTTFKANGKVHGERLHVSTLLYKGRAWVFAMAADSAGFTGAEQIYAVMLGTFRPR